MNLMYYIIENKKRWSKKKRNSGNIYGAGGRFQSEMEYPFSKISLKIIGRYNASEFTNFVHTELLSRVLLIKFTINKAAKVKQVKG